MQASFSAGQHASQGPQGTQHESHPRQDEEAPGHQDRHSRQPDLVVRVVGRSGIPECHLAEPRPPGPNPLQAIPPGGLLAREQGDEGEGVLTVLPKAPEERSQERIRPHRALQRRDHGAHHPPAIQGNQHEVMGVGMLEAPNLNGIRPPDLVQIGIGHHRPIPGTEADAQLLLGQIPR